MGIVAFQLVNYTLSFLMWMVVGRGILTLIAGGRENLVLLAFARITGPVFAATRRLLPFVAERWVPAAAFFLIVLARVALILALHPAAGR